MRAAKTNADPANILVYSLDEKNFAYFKTSTPEKWRFSIKVTPDRFVELTGIPGVKPARYRGRYHWITIVNVKGFPAAYLRELVEWSHRHAFESLRVSRRRALLAQEAYSAIGNIGDRMGARK